MTETMASIDVAVPVRTAYDQWTQFEAFPRFLTFVEEVTQQDDTHTHWRVKIAGAEREFDAEITEQHPDERVAWNSTSGDVNHAGVVTFHRLSESSSRVTVQLSWDPVNLTEKLGAIFGVDDAAIKKDLENFKDFIEDERNANGGWRGDVS
jgi:uncharacterized membrane protein